MFNPTMLLAVIILWMKKCFSLPKFYHKLVPNKEKNRKNLGLNAPAMVTYMHNVFAEQLAL